MAQLDENGLFEALRNIKKHVSYMSDLTLKSAKEYADGVKQYAANLNNDTLSGLRSEADSKLAQARSYTDSKANEVKRLVPSSRDGGPAGLKKFTVNHSTIEKQTFDLGDYYETVLVITPMYSTGPSITNDIIRFDGKAPSAYIDGYYFIGKSCRNITIKRYDQYSPGYTSNIYAICWKQFDNYS